MYVLHILFLCVFMCFYNFFFVYYNKLTRNIPPFNNHTPSSISVQSFNHQNHKQSFTIGEIDSYFLDKRRIRSFQRTHYISELKKKGFGSYDDYRAFMHGIPDGYKEYVQHAELTEKQNIIVVIVNLYLFFPKTYFLI